MKPALHASVVWSGDGGNRGRTAKLPTEDRREHRYFVDQSVQVFAPGAAARMWTAQIRDISTRGMQLMVDGLISFGPEIRIRWNGRVVNGTICYNHKFDETRCRVGVELRSTSEPMVIEILARQSEELQQVRTELKQQEALLGRYVSLLHQASEALIVTSLNGEILFWNQGAERIYGWTSAEAVGRLVNHLFESRMPSEMTAASEAALCHLRKDGSEVGVKSRSIVQLEADGQTPVILFVNREL
jgi:PAS domain S-box-containing protein